jgi:hypothetical protein
MADLQSAFEARMQEQSEFHYILFAPVSRMIWASGGRRESPPGLRAAVRQGPLGQKNIDKTGIWY